MMINALRRLNLIPATWWLPCAYKQFCAEVSVLDEFAGKYLLERAPGLQWFTPVCDITRAFVWDDAVGGREFWERVHAQLLAYRYMASVVMITSPSNSMPDVLFRYRDCLESLTNVIVQYNNSPGSYAAAGLLTTAMDEVRKQLETV